MKNLKKFAALVLFLSVLVPQAFSQSFGIRAGVNLADMYVNDEEGGDTDFEMKPGFQLGPVAEFAINDKLAFETGLLLSSKGTKLEESGDKFSFNPLYLDIPLNAKLYFNTGDTRFFASAGPYLGFGVGGKYKVTYDGESDSEEIEFGEGKDMKRMDFGLSVGAGVSLSPVQVGLSYGLGLADIEPDSDDSYVMKNRVISFTVTYLFGGK
jgi:hypothetical protein